MKKSPNEAGRAAFHAGMLPTDNPHFGETAVFEEWNRGWLAAQWAEKVHRSVDEAEESRERAARIIKAEEQQ